MLWILMAVVLLAAFGAWEWGRLHRPSRAARAGEPAPAWVGRLTAGELAEIWLRLLSRLGYTMLAQTVEGDHAELTAADAAHNGRRLLLRAFAATSGPLTGAQVREAVEHARAEGCNRVLVVGLAGLSAQAEHDAQSLPVELLDGADLAALAEQHLPELGRDHVPRMPAEPPRPAHA